MMSIGIFQIGLHFIKYRASGIGQLKLMIWSGFVSFVKLVRPANLTDLGGLVPIYVLFSVLHLRLW